MNREMLYNDLSGFLAMHFPCKVQKISINAGFTCPNRDGSVGYEVHYCNNQTFNPAYCHTGKSVTQQLEEGEAEALCTQISGNEISGLFSGLYQYLWGTGRVEKKIRRGADGRGCGTTGDRNSSGLYVVSLLDYLEVLGKRTFVLVEYGIESADVKHCE